MAVGRKTGGRQLGARNKTTIAREEYANAALRLALSEEPSDYLKSLLPIDFLQLSTLAAYKAGDVKLTGELAYRWAEFVHPKKTELNVGLTLDDIRRIANAARAEAARRGLVGEAAGRGPPGAAEPGRGSTAAPDASGTGEGGTPSP
jgi:hypothetical protein